MTKETASALSARFIIDGIRQELTPCELLDAVCDAPEGNPAECAVDSDGSVIVDETPEVGLTPLKFDRRKVKEYLDVVLSTVRKLPVAYADTYTRGRIAASLTDCLWRQGRFKLGDITVRLDWKWNSGEVGNMAAFYSSVAAAAEYIDSLGIRISSYSYSESRECSLSVKVAVRPADQEDIFEIPYRSARPKMKSLPALPSTLVPDLQSWIVYIPFESSDYRFGGSILSQALGKGGGCSLRIEDPDYFIDCFEVLRELVEDGILLSASTVSDGGLIAAVKRMTSESAGACIDVSDVMKAAHETDVVRVLFAEVPGVVVQIRDIDFDYLDAELLLQDVAFFPLGHPSKGSDVRVRASEKSGIQTILESLIQNQCGEGED